MRRLWCKIRTGQSTKLSSYVINYSNSFGVCIHLPCELPTLHIYSWKIYRRSSLRDSAKFPLIAIVVGIVQNTSVNTQMSSGNIFCNIHHIFFCLFKALLYPQFDALVSPNNVMILWWWTKMWMIQKSTHGKLLYKWDLFMYMKYGDKNEKFYLNDKITSFYWMKYIKLFNTIFIAWLFLFWILC